MALLRRMGLSPANGAGRILAQNAPRQVLGDAETWMASAGRPPSPGLGLA